MRYQIFKNNIVRLQWRQKTTMTTQTLKQTSQDTPTLKKRRKSTTTLTKRHLNITDKNEHCWKKFKHVFFIERSNFKWRNLFYRTCDGGMCRDRGGAGEVTPPIHNFGGKVFFWHRNYFSFGISRPRPSTAESEDFLTSLLFGNSGVCEKTKKTGEKRIKVGERGHSPLSAGRRWEREGGRGGREERELRKRTGQLEEGTFTEKEGSVRLASLLR